MVSSRSSFFATAVLLLATAADARFDFGGASCSGSGTFSTTADSSRVTVGDIPIGVEGLIISIFGDNVDMQLTSGTTEVINWNGGIISERSGVTKTWNGDSITYSGYEGTQHETVAFHDATDNAYRMYAYGYGESTASVTYYSWTGIVGCQDEPSPSGKGTSFQQRIAKGNAVTVGELPAGLSDVYVRVDSAFDVDIQLYDEDTAVVNRQGGLLSASGFERKAYNGLQIQYSGYNGEQRGEDSFGQEYILIEGVLPRALSIRVLGHQSGNAEITYSWGYYATAIDAVEAGTTSLNEELHEIIDDHDEVTYTPGCWDALKRTDQDKNDPDSVVLFYSRRSELKENRDNGTYDPDAWNREHIWAKSHGYFSTARGPGTDIHALRPADRSVNTERSAKDFASGGKVLSGAASRGDCPTCLETSDTFEPPDEVKGDAARMIFYMAVRYNGDAGSNGLSLNVVDGVGTPFGRNTKNDGEIGDLSTLLEWHYADPVSDEERHRNNIIYDIQGNRNPFVDKPEFAAMVFS